MATPANAPGGAGGLHVVVISPEKTVYDGQAESVVAPAWDGEVGILRNHAPMMALLGSGQMRVTSGGSVSRFTVEGGFLQVADNVVTVLSEPRLLETLFNAFRLVLFFSLIPVGLGLVTASVIQRVAGGRHGSGQHTPRANQHAPQ